MFFRKASLPTALLLGLAPFASALVIRHDLPTTTYENYARTAPIWNTSTPNFRANDTDFGISGASAIDSRWGVHARHTLRSVSDWIADGNNAVTRGRTFNAANNTGLGGSSGGVQVAQVIHFDDDFTRFANAIDIALVQAAAPTSAQSIAPLYTGTDEVGRVGNMVSAANNRRDGNGNDRRPENEANSISNRPTETTWAADNMVDQTNGQGLGSPANALLRVDFDNPDDPSDSNMGSNQPLDLEAGSMSGDSGSPIYIDKNGLNGQIAGVLSGGSGNTYGTTVIYVRISPYVTWITDTILANPDSRTLDVLIPDLTVPVGTELSFFLSETSTEVNADSPIDTLTPTFTLVSGPTGATLDPATGLFTWTPQPADAGGQFDITVQVQENGVVANSAEGTFQVCVPTTGTPFWSWSTPAPNWSQVTVSGGSPYRLGSAYPYIQGGTNNLVYQQASGTIPAGATVRITAKLADFEQTWSNGGPVEIGLRDAQPTVANAADPFLFSTVVDVPNHNLVTLDNGLGNTGQPVVHSFTFQTTSAITNPYFTARKNFNGGRIAVDDITIEYVTDDADWDGLSDSDEVIYGTDSSLQDTDGDGFKDGYEVNFLGTDPTSALDPQPENGLPHTTSFENGLDGWVQVTDDVSDWIWHTGPTPDNGSGPTGASLGDRYLYHEGHDQTGVHYKSASIERTFNFAGATSPQLTFDYHTFGPFIDYIAVDIHDGTTWTERFFEVGQEQTASEDPWSTATVDLASFAGLPNVTVRLRAQQGEWFLADMAIDNVSLVDLDANTPTPAVGINFTTSAGPALTLPTLPASTPAGAPGALQQNWNNTESLNGNSGSTLRIASPIADTLVDSEGNPTAMEVSFTMNNAWSTNNTSLTSYAPLLSGYLDTNGSNPISTVTLSQIPYSEYDVYVYFGSDQNNRTGQISDGVTTYSFRTLSQDPEFAGTYVQTTDTGSGNPSANYAVFSSKTDSSLTLTYTRGSGNGGMHGIQVVSKSVALSPYELWATDAFTGAPAGTDTSETGNPDGDNFTNLEEWLLVTNPLLADSPVLTSTRDGNSFSITYNRRDIGSPSVRAAWSDTLLPGSWKYAGELLEGEVLTETIESSLDGIDSMSATIPMTGAKRFMRLEIFEP